jgi:hypothetical protein
MIKPAVLAAIGAGLIGAGGLIAVLAPSAPAGPSQACRAAQSQASAYARYVRTDTTFPNDSAPAGDVIVRHELALLRAMTRAGCPASVKVVTLP